MWILIVCSLPLVTFDNARKNGPKSFHHWKKCLFLKNCVCSYISGPKKWSCHFHSNSQNTFWTLIYCPLKFVTNENKRKIGQNFSFTEKIDFFFKILCFQQPLRWCRTDIVSSTLIVKIHFGPKQFFFWGLSQPIIGQKLAKTFPSLKRLPFFQKFDTWIFYFAYFGFFLLG